jgi:hypothetical protein
MDLQYGPRMRSSCGMCVLNVNTSNTLPGRVRMCVRVHACKAYVEGRMHVIGNAYVHATVRYVHGYVHSHGLACVRNLH